MNQEEHVSMARELMGRADKESGDGGNEMIAAEFLWGAFAHCLNTVALNQGLSHDSHGAFGRISQRLDAVHGDNEWRSRFGSAERLHFHFYHGNLPTEELRSHRRATRGGTLELLTVL